jgi:SNF2 family DNA or RNA helicase
VIFLTEIDRLFLISLVLSVAPNWRSEFSIFDPFIMQNEKRTLSCALLMI